MPRLTIDGREIEVAEGTTVIRAATAAGIEIPHFCWHPELSIAANCRMCLVEMENSPKLVAACQQTVADGMAIRTTTPRVREARRAVMEYLLLDHPVDCPICDQAGECKLQDYYMLHDLGQSRLWSEDHKIRRVKRKVFGRYVIYDAERCVLCTRCVRVCEEFARDPALVPVNRGDRREIALAPGRTLDHPYSLMTVRACPVGALTSRDFRFQKRVWFLASAEVVCPGCATGCAAYLDHCDGVAYRLRPRDNPDVNRTWLCDDGVLSYRLHNDGRSARPEIGRGEGKPASWPEALAEAAAALSRTPKGKVAAVLSAEHTCEENHALVVFAREALGIERFFLAVRADGRGDDILRSADRNPNRAGARMALGAQPEPIGTLLEAAAAGSIAAAIALGSEA
ncbi:MAG: 2Fe-2S iron-sulfur cluster-binding protein, partial [Myxococcota bacterium]|nr:2Fe-2S iron-sulfur cluster-binding protein [Myxococcota bacterium]